MIKGRIAILTQPISRPILERLYDGRRCLTKIEIYKRKEY